MLSLLLDENLSPEIVRQITEKRADVSVTSVYYWHEGRYLAQGDEPVLRAAAQDALTLVTYDQKTILPVLRHCGQTEIDHAGVIFIDGRSIASNNFGAIMRALLDLWDASHADDWTNRVDFLRATP